MWDYNPLQSFLIRNKIVQHVAQKCNLIMVSITIKNIKAKLFDYN